MKFSDVPTNRKSTYREEDHEFLKEVFILESQRGPSCHLSHPSLSWCILEAQVSVLVVQVHIAKLPKEAELNITLRCGKFYFHIGMLTSSALFF